MPPKFSMSKCAKATNKRVLEDAPGSASKIPRAGDVVVDAIVPRTSSTRAANAPVVLCIYKWTSKAGDILPEYAEKDVGLFQTCTQACTPGTPQTRSIATRAFASERAPLRIQIDHDCRNSVVFQFKNKFQAFLRAMRASSDALPDNLEDLAAQAGIHLVIAPGDTSKGGVFTPWRVALYVAGDEAAVRNALLLLDAFWTREVRPANGEPTSIHIYPHTSIDVTEVKEARMFATAYPALAQM